jgi:hypothetical protein
VDTVYENFVAFVEAEVLPRLLQNPQHARLDGWTESKGNWTVIALFRHDGHVWRVHADSHYEPLILAYYGVKFRHESPTFVRTETDKDGVRLDLSPELGALRPTRRANARYLYIYQVE